MLQLLQSVRNNCVNQLMPSDNPIKRIKVKVFGSSGVGKSTLIESLKSTSYIGSFFRRSWFGGSTSTSVENKSRKLHFRQLTTFAFNRSRFAVERLLKIH
jgi:ABC-type phosphate/phosphonate transport system ATPase subunit